MADLNDFASTINELKRLGSLTEEEITLLENLGTSIEQISKEIKPLEIKFVNSSSIPDPLLKNHSIILRNPYSIFISPHESIIAKSEITLINKPENIDLIFKPTIINFPGVIFNGYLNEFNQITFHMYNTRNERIFINPNVEICKVSFYYVLSENYLSFVRS